MKRIVLHFIIICALGVTPFVYGAIVDGVYRTKIQQEISERNEAYNEEADKRRDACTTDLLLRHYEFEAASHVCWSQHPNRR